MYHYDLLPLLVHHSYVWLVRYHQMYPSVSHRILAQSWHFGIRTSRSYLTQVFFILCQPPGYGVPCLYLIDLLHVGTLLLVVSLSVQMLGVEESIGPTSSSCSPFSWVTCIAAFQQCCSHPLPTYALLFHFSLVCPGSSTRDDVCAVMASLICLFTHIRDRFGYKGWR